ncbi:ribonuclease HI family protein [Arthrobacter sp. ISL-30]|uniref:ribonuclease HI family protein n=1 Tax=Arthrobacter sp. ISL-30 TaxID=2819109 RepID=UPI001BE9EB02|nr:ribonuclease HI family protein [Arthrobacter sp. ISL-30]MBT2512816.1 ribonuclease HI family protein [Arthrobacter sp. ISL-30]
MTITAAADGSALGNPGPAGWAWYVNDSCWRAGGWPHGTNNQGELMAVLDLFRQTAHLPDEELHILCDSQYVINCITKWMPGWKRKGWRKADGKPVLNVELLKDIDTELIGRKYTFEWVKGHAGHDLNEAADERARAVAIAYQQGLAVPAGPGFSGSTPWSRAAAQQDAELRTGRPGAVTGAAAPVAQEPSLFDQTTSVEHSPVESSSGEVFGEEAEEPLYTPEEEPVYTEEPSYTQEPSLFDDEEAFAEPVLFTESVDGAPVNSGRTDEETVLALEKELLRPDVRADLGRTGVLLHPDFTEIGTSGRFWTRDAMMMSLEQNPAEHGDIELLGSDRIGDNAILLTYRSYGRAGTVLRTSLWVLDGGQWRLRFHQGTPEA